ncbi:STE/STE7/MEK1 protein kinase [Cryptococcus wingfieldii CBS 7118]|uniref:STE/STE7/MEK1 protein kinase n=1 Tax=Cryptococcus wingfieldii CBS 7118 TaxID=1295528 RepID=A0A1E3K2H7_9TREE|nr:STE/STE7/MEK1 protein kinase [Cryptococcus wingfieldii CBS 7118]ODO07196.1 STE/STE7/MEK1 protein kinase [Cryptococcus wingfieldii CBS 7118]
MVTLDPPSSSTASVAITSPNSTPTPTQQSTFSLPKSTISRKKPPGLDISKSILRPTRSAPGLPPNGDSPVGNFVSEADKLRDDIAQLQLSSRSTGSHRSDDEAEAAGLQSDDSAASGAHKKEKKDSKSGKDGKEKKRRRHKDKNGEDLVKEEDLDNIEDLGAGNGGTVAKVWNKKRKCIMAKKLVMVDAKPSIRKQILRELQIMNDCDSPYIVGYYGCFPVDVHVGIVMEFMDAGSLDHIYRKNGPIDIGIVGKCAEAVVRGLMYLYDEHRIIHRDIKPSNILVNTKGEVKICDFGVSGELINSIANTFVGTSTYMSPERIQGTNYTIKSDIWSLAISIIELATGRFPFSDNPDADDLSPTASDFDPDPTLPRSAQRPQVDKKERVSVAPAYNMSILDLLQYIVNEPAPKLASRRFKFPEEAVEWVDDCLIKDPDFRPGPKELLAMDWVANSKVTQDDLRSWAQSLKKD